MPPTSLVIGIPLTVIMVLAAAGDLRTRRIPNALTVAGMGAAPVLWALAAGPAAGMASLVGGVLALLVAAPLFALGALGGGDAKLLVVAGAFLGPARLVSGLLVIGVTGSVLALAVAVWERRVLQVLIGAWTLSLHLITLGRKGSPHHVTSPGALTVPYGVAIAVGALTTWFFVAPALAV